MFSSNQKPTFKIKRQSCNFFHFFFSGFLNSDISTCYTCLHSSRCIWKGVWQRWMLQKILFKYLLLFFNNNWICFSETHIKELNRDYFITNSTFFSLKYFYSFSGQKRPSMSFYFFTWFCIPKHHWKYQRAVDSCL